MEWCPPRDALPPLPGARQPCRPPQSRALREDHRPRPPRDGQPVVALLARGLPKQWSRQVPTLSQPPAPRLPAERPRRSSPAGGDRSRHPLRDLTAAPPRPHHHGHSTRHVLIKAVPARVTMLISTTRRHISIDPLTMQPVINRRLPHRADTVEPSPTATASTGCWYLLWIDAA